MTDYSQFFDERFLGNSLCESPHKPYIIAATTRDPQYPETLSMVFRGADGYPVSCAQHATGYQTLTLALSDIKFFRDRLINIDKLEVDEVVIFLTHLVMEQV